MYILVQEPNGDEAKRAFNALDDAFGTDSFSKSEALQALTEHGFTSSMFEALLTSGCIAEE